MSSSHTETNTDSIKQAASAAKLVKKHKKIPDCNICHEKLTKETFIRCVECKQYFCKSCVKNWLLSLKSKNSKICPLCAKQWSNDFICNNFELGFVVYELELNDPRLFKFTDEEEGESEHSEELSHSREEDESEHSEELSHSREEDSDEIYEIFDMMYTRMFGISIEDDNESDIPIKSLIVYRLMREIANSE